ncbi:MAG: response regulator, partial [Cytophagia bacterium]|nr:response regulator [Cytophagia bacterium]
MQQGMRIIIVEDETIIAEYLKNVIEGKGHHVKVLLTGDIDFSQYLSENNPDLVFLDIHLNSKQTGVDFAKVCHEQGIAFVYLTSYSDSKTINSAFE